MNKTRSSTYVCEAIYYKRATASEPSSYTWNFSTTATYAATILRYTGVIQSGSPINQSSNRSATSGSIRWNSVTPTVANTMLVAFVTTYNAGATLTDPVVLGTTLANRLKQTAAQPSFGSWDRVLTGTTSTGNFTYGTGAPYVTHVIVLTPQSGPTITAVSPTNGAAGGGATVTVTGTNFVSGATTVNFGSTAATSISVTSTTSLTCVAPAGTGVVDVRVTTVGGTSAVVTADRFTYAPVISSVSPTAGPLGGGTSVTITGAGFTGATAVRFGTTAAASYTVNSDTKITATSPAGTGTVDITVTAAGYTSATGTADRFTYASAPTITGLSPTYGVATGGTSVTITGTNFTGATAVKFGGTAAAGYTVVSATSITAVSAAGTGVVDVSVTTVGGTNTNTAADNFAYVPVVSSVSPSAGPLAGGTSVTITGSGFSGAPAVKFGTAAAAGYTVNSDTKITATSPAALAGVVDLTVTASGYTSATSSADRFTYTALPVVTIIPTYGPATGGTSVILTGSNFTGATAVKFGTTAAASYTVNSDTQITAVSPAGTGVVDVSVTAVGGINSNTANDNFTYVPVVSAVGPTTGPAGGGTSVTITGSGFTSATGVKFGTTTTAGYTVNSDTQITAVSPAGSAGTVDITVTASGYASTAVAGDHFTYVAAPTVTGVSPDGGTTGGGTSVTITGTNLTGATAVKFGTTAAASYTVNSPTSMTAVSPAGSVGTVDVTVTTTGGTSATSSADRFTFMATPTVSDVSPDAGPTSGDTDVVITGTGFSQATTVRFGSTSASFSVDSSTQITATAPAGSAGSVHVRVTNAAGTSTSTSADYYTYIAPPNLTSLSPDSGSVNGGETITITGTDFDDLADTVVTFGDNDAVVTSVTSTSIVCTAPATDIGGDVDVVVTTRGGSDILSNGYTYVGSLNITTPTVSDFGPLTLNGSALNTTASMGTFDVSDSRGTDQGWNVTVQATRLTSGTHTLPLGSLWMPQPTVTKDTLTSSDPPDILPGPYAIDVASPVKIASAPDDGSGEGAYTFTIGDLTLNPPASAYAGTYTTTVTVSVISGP